MENGNNQKFDCWAIVELMGHQIIAGKVTEESIAGAGFIRVDVPQATRNKERWEGGGTLETPEYTRYLQPNAIYALNPCTEEVARAAAASRAVTPPDLLRFAPKPALPESPDGNKPATNIDEKDIPY